MATGIKDKVAILGMGCSRFGERWADNAKDLMVEAFSEALDDAGIDKSEIGAAWLGTGIETQHLGKGAIPMGVALRLDYIPITRVENFCASGTEALRGAVYAVASGACDIALALGVEKLKDTGYGGLPQQGRGTVNDMVWPSLSGPGAFAQLASAYGETRQSIGLAQNNTMVEVFASTNTGTWTIAITNAAGLTCLVASGQAFERLAETLPTPAEDA